MSLTVPYVKVVFSAPADELCAIATAEVVPIAAVATSSAAAMRLNVVLILSSSSGPRNDGLPARST
jgi:hypothetical protein